MIVAGHDLEHPIRELYFRLAKLLENAFMPLAPADRENSNINGQ